MISSLPQKNLAFVDIRRIVCRKSLITKGTFPYVGSYLAPNNPSTGAVQALAVDSTNANIIYAAATDGGIWKTTNATAANAYWMPLNDQSLPAETMESIALSPVNPRTIFAGTGDTASFTAGNLGFGIVRSTDIGEHWQVLAANTFSINASAASYLLARVGVVSKGFF